MKIEEAYEDIAPEIDWGYCPGPGCDGTIEWFEEGPICPDCGHLWDHEGHDIGCWEENMGEPWADSRASRNFKRRAEERQEWIQTITAKLGGNE